MLIENSFDVDADPDRVFDFLQNPHNVATCFPGAELTEDLGDDRYKGTVKIKLGPVTAAFTGVATITERDEAARLAVLVAEGKDARGSGTAKATATMRVEPKEDGGSSVRLRTDLTISGRLAQFGRGIMADVSTRMVNDLAVRVRERIESAPVEEPAATSAAATSAVEAAEAAEATPDQAAPVATKAAVTKHAATKIAGAETAEASAGAGSGAVSGTTTDTATGPATEQAAESPAVRTAEEETTVKAADKAAASARATAPTPATAPAATGSAEPAGAIKATTLLKVMIGGVFRRLFARLRGHSGDA